MKIIILLLLFYLVNASIYQYDFELGIFSIHYIYSDQSSLYDRIVLVRYNKLTEEVWFQAVYNTSTVKNVACKRISQERIITGPNGCSNIADPTLAIESSNCIENEVDVIQRRALFHELWYLSKDSDECYSGGGNGDIRICPGPLCLSIANEDSFQTRDFDIWPTGRDLLKSKMRFIETLTGPMAMSPALVELDMVLPALRVNTNCTTPYNQTYRPWYQDDASVTYTYSFKGNQFEDLSVVLKSDGGEYDFYIEFVNNVGDYEVEFRSAPLIGTATTESVLADWFDLIEFNFEYEMYVDDVYTCVATFSLDEPENRFQLNDLYEATANNYSWNQMPPRYNHQRVANFHQGRLNHANELVYADCLEGDECGGEVIYVHPEYPNLPIYVPVDSTLDFRLSCNEFYPKNESFEDLGGTQRPRMIRQSCFSSFILPSLILLNINPDEKYKQCQMLGGYTYLSTQAMCSMAVTQTYCKKHYYYFNQRCYYKFNPTTDGRYAVPIDQMQSACEQLNPYAKALIEVDEYLTEWIFNWYLYQYYDLNTVALYRIPRYKSDLCTCFNSLTGTQAACNCYSIKESGLSIFPVCYYPITTIELEPKYAFASVSLGTAILWQNGQEGPKQGGFQAQVRCFDSWTGGLCHLKTCSLGTIVVGETNVLAVTFFFNKCYTHQQGSCNNLNPNICKCNYPYAPHASAYSNLGELYAARDHPCACPATVSSESFYFQVNETVYDISRPNELTPCGGTNQGTCSVDYATNLGRCNCIERTNVLRGILEESFDGKSCACERPVIPWGGDSKNGIVISDLCNHRGTCCPFGESVINPIVGDVSTSVCYENDGTPLIGCVCDNGFGGES